MTDPKHTCHLPGCGAPCPPRHLFCGPHWHMVPPPLQDEVYRTVRLRGPRVNASWAPWWRAQAEATAAVGRQRDADSPKDLAALERWLGREMKFADRLEEMNDD